MEKGWFKLYRKLEDEPFYKKSHYVHLWIHILMRASREGRKVVINGETLDIPLGSIVTGRKRLASETGIKESTIRSTLSWLEVNQLITISVTPKFSVITVNNWEKYQETTGSKTLNHQNLTRTSPQYKKENKNKNNKTNNKLFVIPTQEEVEGYFREYSTKCGLPCYPSDDEAEEFIDYYNSNGWLVGNKAKMKDWKSAVRRWFRNSEYAKARRVQ